MLNKTLKKKWPRLRGQNEKKGRVRAATFSSARPLSKKWPRPRPFQSGRADVLAVPLSLCGLTLRCPSLVQSHMRRPTITHMQDKYCGDCYDIYPIQSQYTKVAAFGRHHKRGGAAFGHATSFVVSFVLALNRVNIVTVTTLRCHACWQWSV